MTMCKVVIEHTHNPTLQLSLILVIYTYRLKMLLAIIISLPSISTIFPRFCCCCVSDEYWLRLSPVHHVSDVLFQIFHNLGWVCWRGWGHCPILYLFKILVVGNSCWRKWRKLSMFWLIICLNKFRKLYEQYEDWFKTKALHLKQYSEYRKGRWIFVSVVTDKPFTPFWWDDNFLGKIS